MAADGSGYGIRPIVSAVCKVADRNGMGCWGIVDGGAVLAGNAQKDAVCATYPKFVGTAMMRCAGKMTFYYDKKREAVNIAVAIAPCLLKN